MNVREAAAAYRLDAFPSSFLTLLTRRLTGQVHGRESLDGVAWQKHGLPRRRRDGAS